MKLTKTKIVLLSLIFSLCFSVAASAEVLPQKLTVSGNGTLKVAPDIAYLNVGVRTTDKDAEAASLKNSEVTESVVAALKNAGIPEADIKTQYYYVNPVYDYSTFDRGENTITGYEVSNSLNITIRQIDAAGKTIDVCIAAGANIINGLSYSVETPSKYYDVLFERAVADANRKAASIAKALSVKLSTPVSVSEGGYVNASPSYVNLNMGMRDAVAGASSLATTYTSPGDIDLYANVLIIFDYE